MFKPYFITISLLLLILMADVVNSQQCSSEVCQLGSGCAEVSVGFQGNICSTEQFYVSLGSALATGNGKRCTQDSWGKTNKAYATLRLDTVYQVRVGAASCSTHVNFDVPPGYTMYIDGQERATIDKSGNAPGMGDGVWNVVVRKDCPCNGAGDGVGQTFGLKAGSIMWGVGLGDLSDSRSAESISIYEKVLSAIAYTPAALTYTPPPNTSEIDVVRTLDNSLRQIKAPQTFVDIYVINEWEYDIRFYHPSNVGAKVEGRYSVIGQPLVTYKIKNPNPPNLERFQVSKIENDRVETTEIKRDGTTSGWSLTEGNNERIETVTNTFNQTTNTRTQTTVVKNSAGQIASTITRKYKTYQWGEELTDESIGSGSNAILTTRYSYFTDSTDTVRYRKLYSIMYPDQSWKRFDYDEHGNRILEVSTWKSGLLPGTESNSRVIRYTYTNFDGIDYSLFPKYIDSVEVKIEGKLVQKTTYARSKVIVNGETAIAEAVTVYSSPTAWQTTTTTRYAPTASPWLANRAVSVEYPDGKKDTYSYEKGNYISNSDPAMSEFIPSANGKAERETVTHGTVNSPDGIAYKTTREVSISNELGNSVFIESLVYTGAGYERIGWTANSYDERNRPVQTIYHNGKITSSKWDGDRLASTKDENGIETVFTYDPLGRVSTRTKKGIYISTMPGQADITTTYTYDADGRVLEETTSGGILKLKKITKYDAAGRVIQETDAAGLITTYRYENTNSRYEQTITLPGGAIHLTSKYWDGQIAYEAGNAIVRRYFDYGVNTDGTRYTIERINGTTSPRYTKTIIDWAGRTIKVEKRSFTGADVIQTFAYNDKGQLQKETLYSGTTKLQADKLYDYDELGNRIRFGLDIDADGRLTTASTDRFSEKEISYELINGAWYGTNINRTYQKEGNSTPTIQTQQVRLNNFSTGEDGNVVYEIKNVDVVGNVTLSTISIDRDSKKVTERTDIPESSSDAISVTVNGLLQTSIPSTPEDATAYTYDDLGRVVEVKTASSGTQTSKYDSTTGQLIETRDKDRTTVIEYYPANHMNAGLLKSQADNNNNRVYFSYNRRGEVVRSWGTATYPVEYVYDDYGQKVEMRTFRGGSGWDAATWPTSSTGTADVTKWGYDEATGLLKDKTDAAGQQVVYTYDQLGQLSTRKLARLDSNGSTITATYRYDPNKGDLTSIDYSDSTPDVSFSNYDRSGRPTTIVDASGVRTLTYNIAGDLETEQISGNGILSGITTSVGYDDLLRRKSLQSSLGTTVLNDQTYSYDGSGRLEKISSGAMEAIYAYGANSGLLESTTYTGGTTINRGYDTYGRLATISNIPGSNSGITSYSYTYNKLNHRVKMTKEDKTYWLYGYNNRGELVSGKKYWPDEQPVSGQQMEYVYDNIGNRTITRIGGDASGSSLKEATYLADALNQYKERTVPGVVDITGSASTETVVSINNQKVYRKGDYFHIALEVNNSSGPVYEKIRAIAVNSGTGETEGIIEQAGEVYVAKSKENNLYDVDGNQIVDGRWTYRWDAENRLVSMEANPDVPIEAKRKIEFGYDYTGRRIVKRVYGWNGSSYQIERTTKYVYDGWNVIAEVDGNNRLIKSYTWGQDLSGDLDGAGGTGGLLLIHDGESVYQVGYDGNGNITTLVNGSTGTISALYEYDPYGNIIKMVGEYAGKNAFRYGTKYVDSETGLTYYGYRYYNSQTGRWINRDPSEEEGGINLYGYVENNSISNIDRLGLDSINFNNTTPEEMARLNGPWKRTQSKPRSPSPILGLVGPIPKIGKSVAPRVGKAIGIRAATGTVAGGISLSGGLAIGAAILVPEILYLTQNPLPGSLMNPSPEGMIRSCTRGNPQPKLQPIPKIIKEPIPINDDSNTLNQMRVQLQDSKGGRTLNTHAVIRSAPSKTGVTVLQMRSALHQLWEEIPTHAPWFPYDKLENEFFSGVIYLSKRLGEYPPGGVIQGGNFLRYEIMYRKVDFRIDIENLRGHNLRQ
jgi:RHS repeat-associated protein